MKRCTCKSKGDENRGEPRITATIKRNKSHIRVQNVTESEFNETMKIFKRKTK